MSAMQLYSNAKVYFDGKLLAQESSVSINKKSGLNLVFTTVEGLAGGSPGAQTVDISITNAVPSADFELNPDPFMTANEVKEIRIVMAGRETRHNCFVMEADYQHSVNDASKLDIKLTGRFAEFE